MKTEEEFRKFLSALTKLCNKHGFELSACGCCGGINCSERSTPIINLVADTHTTSDGRLYWDNIGVGED